MRLWKNNPEIKGGKYLVQRRDGTVPQWPWFVLGAADRAAPAGLLAYAKAAQDLGYDPEYVADLYLLAKEYQDWFSQHPPGDPDAGPHRKDDPEIIAKMLTGNGA